MPIDSQTAVYWHLRRSEIFNKLSLKRSHFILNYKNFFEIYLFYSSIAIQFLIKRAIKEGRKTLKSLFFILSNSVGWQNIKCLKIWKQCSCDKAHYLLMLGQLREILKKISVYRCGLYRVLFSLIRYTRCTRMYMETHTNTRGFIDQVVYAYTHTRARSPASGPSNR